MNINTKPLLIVVGVIGIIIIGVYILFEKPGWKPEENNKKDNILGNKSYLISEIPVMFESTEIKEELKINTKPKLNVGEKWIYNVVVSDNITGEKTAMDVIYYVENIEKINKSDCYVISVKIYNLLRPELNILMPKYIIYMSKDTGELIKLTVEYMVQDESGGLRPSRTDLDKKIAEPMLYGGFMIGDFMLQPWMLALSKDFKWKVYANTTIHGKVVEEIFEYGVEGVETVNEKECFKVDFRAFNVEENRVTIRKIIWVDVDKRVIVKAKTMIDNLEVIEVNLKSDVYLK